MMQLISEELTRILIKFSFPKLYELFLSQFDISHLSKRNFPKNNDSVIFMATLNEDISYVTERFTILLRACFSCVQYNSFNISNGINKVCFFNEKRKIEIYFVYFMQTVKYLAFFLLFIHFYIFIYSYVCSEELFLYVKLLQNIIFKAFPFSVSKSCNSSHFQYRIV